LAIPETASKSRLRLCGRSAGYLPNDLPPWYVVYYQMQRWLRAGCFETMVKDLRSLLREFAGRKAQPTAMILDSRTLQSTPESGAHGGYDGAKRRNGSKVHAAVDMLGHLLALHGTAASEQDRAQVERLAEEVQQITGDHVALAYVDQGYTGEAAADAAQKHGIQLEAVKHTEAKRGFVLLPRHWVVERSFAWAGVSAVWPETMNASPLPSPASTTSSSPASCLANSSSYSTEVNYRL
jgi:transposase